MKVTLYLKTHSPNADGSCWVHLRFTESSKATYKSTMVKVLPKQWDKKSQRVQKHIDADELNAELQKQLLDAEKMIKHLAKTNQLQSGKQVKKLLEDQFVIEHDFFSFSQVILDRYKAVGQISTRNKNKAVVEKLITYLNKKYHGKGKGKKLPFDSITIQFMEDYAAYCRKYLQNMESTIQKDVKFISKVIQQAIRESHASGNKMKGFTLKVKPYEKVFLVEEEMHLFENVCVNTAKDQKAKDAFIFSARYSGLRVSDLIDLKVGDIKNWEKEHPEIRFMAKKTSKWITVPLGQKALEHIHPYCIGKEKTDYVFDFYLGRKAIFTDLEEYERDLKSIIAYYNRQLQKLGKRAGIEKKITSHVARNSYATSWISYGGDIYALSKILGHFSIKQTEDYAKLLNLPLHNAAKKVRDALENQ